MSELFTEREALEIMDPRGIAQFILRKSNQISEAERQIALANDVLGGYGTTIEEQLDKLHETNTQTIGSPGP